MDRLLSIEEISRRTGLEESLIRFYESEYPDDLPQKIFRGDGLSFDPRAVESFKRIHALHSGKRQGQAVIKGPERYARVMAITSGKGGVGKTNIALNLSIELQRLGRMCVLLDADMGMANVHLLAGLDPKHDIRELVGADKSISELIQEGPEGIGIIPGGGGILTLADSTRYDRMKIVRSLKEVEQQAEIVLVDTGAGMGASVRDFLIAADEIIFVLTPDITSMADAYGLLKGLHQEKYFSDRPIYTVINMAQTVKQAADVALRFAGCAKQFLDREVKSIGYILKDATVGAATVRRTPYSIFRPQARVSINTRNIASRLMRDEMPEIRVSSAFGRYLKMIRDRQ